MGMTITIRIERTELDPQGLKELLAMTCENLGYGVRVVRVEDDREELTKQTSLWKEDKP